MVQVSWYLLLFDVMSCGVACCSFCEYLFSYIVCCVVCVVVVGLHFLWCCSIVLAYCCSL